MHNTGVQQDMGFRRRKKTNSSSRSRHSSRNSNQDDDYTDGRITRETIDIHQLENEAFLEGHEISDSFSIEFASSRNKGLTFSKNGFHSNITEDSASHSVVFRHSDASQTQVGMNYFMNMRLDSAHNCCPHFSSLFPLARPFTPHCLFRCLCGYQQLFGETVEGGHNLVLH